MVNTKQMCFDKPGDIDQCIESVLGWDM